MTDNQPLQANLGHPCIYTRRDEEIEAFLYLPKEQTDDDLRSLLSWLGVPDTLFANFRIREKGLYVSTYLGLDQVTPGDMIIKGPGEYFTLMDPVHFHELYQTPSPLFAFEPKPITAEYFVKEGLGSYYSLRNPVVFAVQYKGTTGETIDIYHWIESYTQGSYEYISEIKPKHGVSINPANGYMVIAGPRGEQHVYEGDYIVQNREGDIYCVPQEDFEEQFVFSSSPK